MLILQKRWLEDFINAVQLLQRQVEHVVYPRHRIRLAHAIGNGTDAFMSSKGPAYQGHSFRVPLGEPSLTGSPS